MAAPLALLLAALAALAAPGEDPAPTAGGRFVPVDLAALPDTVARADGVHGWPDNTLTELPAGPQTLAGLPFTVGPRYAPLASRLFPLLPESTGPIPVAPGARNPDSENPGDGAAPLAAVHVLHGVGWAEPPGTVVAELRLAYADGSDAATLIYTGSDILDWWEYPHNDRRPFAWRGANPASRRFNAEIGLTTFSWRNPHPERPVRAVEYRSTLTGDAAPLLAAATLEFPPGQAPPRPDPAAGDRTEPDAAAGTGPSTAGPAAEAVAVLRAGGASVQSDAAGVPRAVDGSRWRRSPGEFALAAAAVPTLRRVGFGRSSGRPVAAADLKRLAALPELRWLSLNDVTLDPDAPAALAGLPALERLFLRGVTVGGAPLGDAAVPPLASIAALTHLDLSETRVTDAALPALAAAPPHLRLLDVTDAPVTPEAATRLWASRAGLDVRR